jgi:hypothetical protein
MLLEVRRRIQRASQRSGGILRHDLPDGKKKPLHYAEHFQISASFVLKNLINTLILLARPAGLEPATF